MSFIKTVQVDITTPDGTTYNSLSDFGLAIGNTDYVGTPQEDQSNLVKVPGRDGMLDFTDAVFGGKHYSHRAINIEFGGIEDPADWDETISTFRNLFEGEKVKVEFSTMPGWYFTGRVVISKFSHKRALGEFVFAIPYAEPCMYHDYTETANISAGAVRIFMLHVTRKPVIPTITVTQSCTVAVQKTDSAYVVDEFELVPGTTTNPRMALTPETARLMFTGGGAVMIKYSDRRL